MLVECVKEFNDLECKAARKVGDRFEIDEDRAAQINGSGFGTMVVEVEPAAEVSDHAGEDPAGEEPAKAPAKRGGARPKE